MLLKQKPQKQGKNDKDFSTESKWFGRSTLMQELRSFIYRFTASYDMNIMSLTGIN